jgi:Phasin protein
MIFPTDSLRRRRTEPQPGEQREAAIDRALPILSVPALNTFARMTEWYANAFLSLQDEIMRFATARIDSAAALGRSLADCRSWTDASKLQQDWAVSTLHDYVDETNRLVRVATGLDRNLAEIAREEGEEAYETASDLTRSGLLKARRTAKGGEFAPTAAPSHLRRALSWFEPRRSRHV